MRASASFILYALVSGGYEAEGFEKGAPFFEALLHRRPNLVLLDIMLPDGDGLSILGRLKAMPSYEKIPVVLLTAKTSEYDKVKGLDAGADDYVTKPFGVMELLSRLRAVLRRCQSEEKETCLSAGPVTLDYSRRQLLVCGEPCNLTYKEFELLYYLMQNKGIVLSREQIMRRVWGFDFQGESRTVDMHVKTLRQKLDSHGCSDLIKTVRSVGYKIEGERRKGEGEP